MLKVAILMSAMSVATPAAFADFTVYQGRSGKVLGTCDTRTECNHILRDHPGRGESVVNNQTGKERRMPGKRGRAKVKEGKGGH